MKLSILAGSTSQTINVFINDSSSTTGNGLAGLAFDTAGLTAYYALPKAAAVSITLATLAAVTSGFSSGGFKEIDATNMPGWYRFDIPDAALASGRFVNFHFKGATNMAPLPIEIELTAWNNQSATDGGLSKLTSLTFTGANKVDVSVRDFGGTTVTGRDIGLSVLLSSGSGTGQLDFTSGVVKANATQWLGGTIPAVNVTGVPLVDAKYLLGTVFATPATAGIPDVNAKNINNVSTSSVATINANQGTTQPVNFTGTGASALAKSDMVDIAGAAVSTSTAQIGVNAVNVGGTAQTGRDIGASVLLSSGTGTGQLDFTSGVVKASLVQILGTALTETAGQIAAAFKKFFDKATPTGTINSLPDAVPGASGGLLIDDVWTDARAAKLDNLDVAVSTRSSGAALDAAGVRAAVGLGSANLDTQLSGIQSDTDDIQTRLPAALTAGGNMKADALAFSGDTVAADNAESFFDGTGYAGTNNVIPLVTTTTNLTNAATSGDLTATMKTSVTTAATAATPTAAAVTGNVGGNVTGSIGSLAAQAKADVNAEADTALADVGVTLTVTGRIDVAISSRSTYAGTDTAGTTTLLGRLSATRAGYLDNLSAGAAALEVSVQSVLAKLLSYVQLILRKDSAIATDNVIELTAINANGGSGIGSYANTTDSQQALADDSPDITAIADAVWEEPIADHSGTVGSTAEQLAAAGSAGDPWATPIPGAYAAGTAGQILGDRIDAAMSSRAAETTVDTRLPATLVGGRMDSSVGAIAPSFITDIQAGLATSADLADVAIDIGDIKTKTDSLTFTVSGVVDANVEDWKGATAPAMTGDAFARLGAPTGASVSADSAAIKADTSAILTVTTALPNSGALTTIQSDLDNIQTRLPAALTGDGNIKADTLALNGQSSMRIGESIKGIGLGVVSAGATTTSIPTSSTDPGVIATDQFKGRIITFKALTTTAGLRGQSTVIESNTDTGIFTVTALTTSPVATDAFIIT